MMDSGLLFELRRLRALEQWSADLPSMRAVGYRQGWPYLEGDIDLAGFRLAAIQATRQLAKRQITWLRSEVDALAFDPEAPDVRERLHSTVNAFLRG